MNIDHPICHTIYIITRLVHSQTWITQVFTSILKYPHSHIDNKQTEPRSCSSTVINWRSLESVFGVDGHNYSLSCNDNLCKTIFSPCYGIGRLCRKIILLYIIIFACEK